MVFTFCNDFLWVQDSNIKHSMLGLINSQVGDFAGVAVGMTIMLNVFIAG